MTAPRILLAGAALLCLTATPLSAQSPEGQYLCKGSDANGGDPYSGEVAIKKDGPVYTIDWKLGQGGDYTGTALLANKVLAGAYGDGKPYGLAVYKVNEGTLTGEWAASEKKGLGQETLQGSPGLSGVYRITSAKTPEGKAYTGKVTITKNGEAYALRWNLGEESYSGVGILHGDWLVASWGNGASYGAVVYDIEDGRLNGRWAQAGAGPIGLETLTKK